MRTHLSLAASVAVSLVALVATGAQAQTPNPAPPRAAAASGGGTPAVASHGVAVIDIQYILEKYSRFQLGNDQWKKDVETTGGLLKKEDDAITKKAEGLKSLKAGSKEYKALEEELTHKSSDLKIKVSMQEKEFGERKARMLLQSYQEVADAVKNYCDRNGISLVLQFNGAPVDQNNPRAIQAELSKLVVYQNGIDITPIILDDLNRRAAVPATTQRPPAAARK